MLAGLTLVAASLAATALADDHLVSSKRYLYKRQEVQTKNITFLHVNDVQCVDCIAAPSGQRDKRTCAQENPSDERTPSLHIAAPTSTSSAAMASTARATRPRT